MGLAKGDCEELHPTNTSSTCKKIFYLPKKKKKKCDKPAMPAAVSFKAWSQFGDLKENRCLID